jgi:hypothetical protein
MIVASCAVAAAVVVTMYFNGSYAWSKGGTHYDQIAMLAFALAIDGCKCSFLHTAALCRRDGFRAAAFALVILWLPCFGYSTFAGYSYLHTNRAEVSSGKDAHAQERQRAQAIHDQAAADIKLAMTSPPKGKGKEFCDGIARLKTTQGAAADILTRIAPTDANPEVSGLATVTGAAPDRVTFAIAIVPAILIELLASIGVWAVGTRISSNGPRKPIGRRFWSRKREMPPAPENAPTSALGASATPPKAALNGGVQPAPFRLTIPRATAPEKTPS